MIDGTKVLGNLPTGLRDELLSEYKGILVAFREGRWKAAGIDAGRFCEVAYSIAEGAVSGAFPDAASKPNNFPQACKAIESKPPIAVGDHSLRILIPRVLPGIYDIRNNRNIGHVGGDVSPNKMDATFVGDAATWVVAELVRVFHGVSIAEAQETVDALVDRRHPLVWEIGGVRRVLDPAMSASDRALVLLHSSTGWCSIEKLQEWVKYKSKFVAQVLEPLARKLLVELDRRNGQITITPLGIERVEGDLL